MIRLRFCIFSKCAFAWVCVCVSVCVCVCVHAQSCPTLCNPMDCSLPCTSVHGIFCKNIGVGCHFLLQGIFLTYIEPTSLTFPALAGGSSPLNHLGSPFWGRIPQKCDGLPSASQQKAYDVCCPFAL